MKKYLVLAEVCFDWSHGEYRYDYVNNVFLGIVDAEDETSAKIAGEYLLEEYCNNINCDRRIGAKSYESTIELREIK